MNNRPLTSSTKFARLILGVVVFLIWLAFAQPFAVAQETGGELGGGAGIFRPKNPETKRGNTTPSRPAVRPSRPSAADIDERFESAIDAGNDARDARKFAEAEASYRTAIRLKPRDSRAQYGLGNVFADQQRWDDAEKAYRLAVELAPSNADALMALSF